MDKTQLLQEIQNTIGEGVHTSLRKYCRSNEAYAAWLAIGDMPDDEWNNICCIVAQEVVKVFKKHTEQKKAHILSDACPSCGGTDWYCVECEGVTSC